MEPSSIVLLVVGILLVQVAFWVPVLRWLKGRLTRLTQELREELGDAIVLGPTEMIHRGATGRFPKAKGNGVVVLTDERLVVARLVGERFEVVLAEVGGLRVAKWFAGSYRNGRPHIILRVGEHELGFMVEDTQGWVDALRQRLDLDSGPDGDDDAGEDEGETEAAAHQ